MTWTRRSVSSNVVLSAPLRHAGCVESVSAACRGGKCLVKHDVSVDRRSNSIGRTPGEAVTGRSTRGALRGGSSVRPRPSSSLRLHRAARAGGAQPASAKDVLPPRLFRPCEQDIKWGSARCMLRTCARLESDRRRVPRARGPTRRLAGLVDRGSSECDAGRSSPSGSHSTGHPPLNTQAQRKSARNRTQLPRPTVRDLESGHPRPQDPNRWAIPRNKNGCTIPVAVLARAASGRGWALRVRRRHAGKPTTRPVGALR
jgi:hypothetical protein